VSKNDVNLSKRLSYYLRHAPKEIGLTLTDDGWVELATLHKQLNEHGTQCTLDQIYKVVEQSDKQRFAIKNGMIRANQGHSIKVELKLQAVEPPSVLFHGTAQRFISSIKREGLKAMNRHAVHLSADYETAVTVGARHGTPVVLSIDANAMHRDGCSFTVSDNGVWLTDHVPTKYIKNGI
jgi:putative RNA 2'-phosphotransferase